MTDGSYSKNALRKKNTLYAAADGGSSHQP